MDVTEIEKRVDRAIAQPIPINEEVGGFDLTTLGQLMEFAKLMAVSGAAVPKYLRGNPGACLAICSRAVRWQMDPFAVAEKSYMVINRGEERVAFEAQLVHAVVTARAPLQGRLRYEVLGEGDERRCKVWGTFKGESEPHVYVSEPLAKMREARGRNDQGVLKGSPLWDTVPEVQLAYSSVRQWARLFSSETLLGVYTPDEFEDAPIDEPPSAMVTLGERLRAAKKGQARGFDAAHVRREAGSGPIIEGEVQQQEASDAGAQGNGDQPGDQGGASPDHGEPVLDLDQARRAGAGGSAAEHGEQPAGQEPAHPHPSEPAPEPSQPAAKPKKGKRG